MEDEDEVDPQIVLIKTRTVYKRVCRKLNVLPIRKVLRQFGQEEISLKNMSLCSLDLHAVCVALQTERFAVALDFSGNNIQSRGIRYIVNLLYINPRFTEVRVADNKLSGNGVTALTSFLQQDRIIDCLDISGNGLTENDSIAISVMIKKNTTLKSLTLNHNEFRETGGQKIGEAIGTNRSLEDLDLSWNHLRRIGAIEICRGIEKNRALINVNLSWNGLSFEGSVALADALQNNRVLKCLDISSNRINPTAVMELMKGLLKNRTLEVLKIGHNPITAPFTAVLLDGIKRSPHMALQRLGMEGIVVDKAFDEILEEMQKTRYIEVSYDVCLPVQKTSREKMMREIQKPSAFNIDPLRMLYMLKEKNRAQDFFRKINKDQDDGLTRDEISLLFKEAGIPVTVSVVDTIMKFMDSNNDGTIDLQEFLTGDKKMKKLSRELAKQIDKATQEEKNYNKYTRSFRRGSIDAKNFKVVLEKPPHRLNPLSSVEEVSRSNQSSLEDMKF